MKINNLPKEVLKKNKKCCKRIIYSKERKNKYIIIRNII